MNQLYPLPPPDLAGTEDALAWLEGDALALFAAASAGMRAAPVGMEACIYDVLHADVCELVTWALAVAREKEAARPALATAPAAEVSFAWTTARLEDALAVLFLRPGLAPSAQRGLDILARVLCARRKADSDAARNALVLPR